MSAVDEETYHRRLATVAVMMLDRPCPNCKREGSVEVRVPPEATVERRMTVALDLSCPCGWKSKSMVVLEQQ